MKPSPSTFTTLRKHFFFFFFFYRLIGGRDDCDVRRRRFGLFSNLFLFRNNSLHLSSPRSSTHSSTVKKSSTVNSAEIRPHLEIIYRRLQYFYFQETLAKGEFSVCTRCFFIISKVEVPYSSSTQYDSDGFISIAGIQNEDINSVILSCFIFNFIAVLSCHIFYWLTFYLRHSKIDYNIYTKCMLD